MWCALISTDYPFHILTPYGLIFNYSFKMKIKLLGRYNFLGAISLDRLSVPFPKIVIKLPRTWSLRSYIVKENDIGLAVIKILQYRQTYITFL